MDNDAASPAIGAMREAAPGVDTAGYGPIGGEFTYASKTLSEWALEWAHWYLSQTSCDDSPEYDVDGSQCGSYQNRDSPVFFLAPGEDGTVRTECRIARKQALLVPLATFVADGQPSPFGASTPVDDLERQANSIKDTMRDFKFRVDDDEFNIFDDKGVGPIQFSQYIPPEPNYYFCAGYEGVSGELSPLYLVGYFVLLPPGAPGKHEIEFGGTFSYLGWDLVNHVSGSFVLQ